jgi:hypothetical protein
VFSLALWRRCLLVVAGFLLSSMQPALAQEAYFLLMFGSQRTPPDADHSHSFATFVRVRYNGPQPGVPVVEAHTISWLPDNLNIRVLALLPEPGHNFDLHTTLRFVLGDRQRVSLWGPYQIDPELYHRALMQKQLLESGQVRYKAVDSGYPSDRVSNCIHAISSIAEGHRVKVLSPGWGETASFTILQRFSPWIIDTNCPHSWLGSALGLNCYPIIYRNFEHPRSGLFRGVVSGILGRRRDTTASYGPPR